METSMRLVLILWQNWGSHQFNLHWPNWSYGKRSSNFETTSETHFGFQRVWKNVCVYFSDYTQLEDNTKWPPGWNNVDKTKFDVVGMCYYTRSDTALCNSKGDTSNPKNAWRSPSKQYSFMCAKIKGWCKIKILLSPSQAENFCFLNFLFQKTQQ